MTTPEYIQLMSRCAGIVTDLGGILCHAAIVAREFNKPCVVATTSATDRLKTGDLIELDADNGKITILAPC